MRTIGVSMTMALTILTAALVHFGPGRETKRIGKRLHAGICIGVFFLGCFARLICLTNLPAGISADEALLGVQAKALWQTGGFLFSGGLTTHFAQWTGESCGPLMAAITAPFVGVMGMTPLAVRLPQVLLSIAALPAAYGLGCELSGKRAGRWLLAVYALCPYFVLSARLTGGVHATISFLPIALFLMARGAKWPRALYAGCAIMALTAYAQDMMMFIAPASVLVGAFAAVLCGQRKRHALGAAAFGLLLSLPALLTLWVNLTGAQGFTLFGEIEIPALEGFTKAQNVFQKMGAGADVGATLRNKLWAVISAGFFQILTHVNMSIALYAPEGLMSLYMISLPLMLLGALSLLRGCLGGVFPAWRGRCVVIACFAVHMLLLVLYGSEGVLIPQGTTSVFDHSTLLIFGALLMTAGLCRIEARSDLGSAAMHAALLGSFCLLLVHMLGGSYQGNAAMYFEGFGELSARAAAAQAETGAQVVITDRVYPHVQPAQAAEMMYLYASDADMTQAEKARGESWRVAYMPTEQPQEDCIYLVQTDEIAQWDLEAYEYEEVGGYALLAPKAENMASNIEKP